MKQPEPKFKSFFHLSFPVAKQEDPEALVAFLPGFAAVSSRGDFGGGG
jgi:hypothetical protein